MVKIDDPVVREVFHETDMTILRDDNRQHFRVTFTQAKDAAVSSPETLSQIRGDSRAFDIKGSPDVMHRRQLMRNLSAETVDFKSPSQHQGTIDCRESGEQVSDFECCIVKFCDRRMRAF